MVSGGALVELRDVTVNGVLEGINLRVEEGRIVGLFGGNGAGKTTLLRVVFGSLKPSRGTVVRPQKIGASWQNPYLSFYKQTIWEELLQSAEGDKERAYDALEELGLLERRFSSPFSLSVGQARLLSIRLATLWKPQLLIVDEPTTGLDALEKKRVGSFLREVESTVLVASHDVGFLMRYVDEVAVLERGRIIWRGSPGEGVEEGVLPEWG